MVTVMTTTTHPDLRRERFRQELAAASDDALRSFAYSYLGLSALHADRSDSDWHWRVDMIRDEATRRGRPELFDGERIAVEAERAGTSG